MLRDYLYEYDESETASAEDLRYRITDIIDSMYGAGMDLKDIKTELLNL